MLQVLLKLLLLQIVIIWLACCLQSVVAESARVTSELVQWPERAEAMLCWLQELQTKMAAVRGDAGKLQASCIT